MCPCCIWFLPPLLPPATEGEQGMWWRQIVERSPADDFCKSCSFLMISLSFCWTLSCFDIDWSIVVFEPLLYHPPVKDDHTKPWGAMPHPWHLSQTLGYCLDFWYKILSLAGSIRGAFNRVTPQQKGSKAIKREGKCFIISCRASTQNLAEVKGNSVVWHHGDHSLSVYEPLSLTGFPIMQWKVQVWKE